MLVPRPDTLVVTGELVFNHSLGAIARKDLPLNTYEDLRELRISVLRGGSLNERFDTDDTLTKELDTDYIIGLRKMARSEEHTSELQSRGHLVCRLLLEKKKE